MKTKLANGNIYVKGETTDIYQVKTKDINNEMFLKIELTPNKETRENGMEEEYLLVDLLNETIVDVLKENGYVIVNKEQVEYIKNNDF